MTTKKKPKRKKAQHMTVAETDAFLGRMRADIARVEAENDTLRYKAGLGWRWQS